MKKKIAILGATSHIAKGLIYGFFKKIDKYEAYFFARNIDRVQEFLRSIDIEYSTDKIKGFEEFSSFEYDVIINCVGAGTPTKVKELSGEIFELTEKFDNICIDYIKSNSEVLYINLSSGAVFGKEFDKPITEETKIILDINKLTPNDYYALAKINSEAKHRALKNYNIVDLRVFSYFSRFIDLDGKYLMTEMINSIINKNTFHTNNNNILRDYIHPEDFFNLVEKCIDSKNINEVFDVYSLEPVDKFQIIKSLSEKFNMTYTIEENTDFVNATGIKSTYFSQNKKAGEIGYYPRYSSIECIEEEIKNLLNWGKK